MRTRPSPPTIEPLGTGELMPAVLVGFGPEAPDANTAPWRTAGGAGGFPPWLVCVFQQAGGMCMRYPSAFGCLLRLAANADHALVAPGHLIAGFHCMAEDPQIHVLRRAHPHLYPLCQTWGEDYDPTQLQQLREAIEPYFHLPSPESGYEAFVELEEGNPLDFVAGWRMVEVNLDVELIETEQRTYGALWRDGCVFDEAVLERLFDIGSIVMPGHPLRMFLLWENCD